MFAFVVIVVIARQCYQCLSAHSFEDCDAKRVKVTYPDSQHCVSVSAFSTSGVKDEEYVRGCAATCSVSDVHVCNHSNVTWKISCCSSDYCNAKPTSTPTPKVTSPGPAPVYSRKCYQCLSTYSFEDCDAKRVKVTCPDSQHCVSVSAFSTSGVKDEEYVRGCAATCSASDIHVCNHSNVICKISCCSSDYCNAKPTSTPVPKPTLPGPAPVYSRKCYQCLSKRSFEDCDAKGKKVVCSNSRSCTSISIRLTSGIKEKVYGKGCGNIFSVSEVSICREPNITCEVSCCSSDYCNGYLPTTAPPKPPRQCFECLSNRSFEDCDARRTIVTCKSSQPCLKATVISTSDVKLQAYGKGCAPGCSVSDLPFCREPNITCELSCCSSDYCNGYLPTTSTPSISSSVLLSSDSRFLFMVIGAMYICGSRMFKRLFV